MVNADGWKRLVMICWRIWYKCFFFLLLYVFTQRPMISHLFLSKKKVDFDCAPVVFLFGGRLSVKVVNHPPKVYLFAKKPFILNKLFSSLYILFTLWHFLILDFLRKIKKFKLIVVIQYILSFWLYCLFRVNAYCLLLFSLFSSASFF